jgi:carboxyl-terminal processing protease
MKNSKVVIIASVSVLFGILMGAGMMSNQAALKRIATNANKFKEIVNYIETAYVDSVNTDSLVDYSIRKMLDRLDPHTRYMNPIEAEMSRASLLGGYDGVGIEFNVYQDSLYVTNPMVGGPSEAAGVLSGDVILKADSVKLVGSGLNNSVVYKNLRGPKGTVVVLSIKRKGLNEVLSIPVKRDRIASFTVTAALLLDQKTGYIKVNRFAATTMTDFREVLGNLKQQGMQQLILDLRGNPGGYMDRATDMVDELLAGNGIIVYTKGRAPGNSKQHFANKNGLFEKEPIIVLVDENSASASEIVSGALQDHDRALIMGRRTFGKGLVQQPITLSDGSELRMTISKYYIPSGRSVQRPFELGKEDDYKKANANRQKTGEYFIADSIKHNKALQFKTLGGRTVYGGGGVTPDYFVPKDTSHYSPMLFKIWAKSLQRQFAFDYAQNNANKLKKMGFENFDKKFAFTDADWQAFEAVVKKGKIDMPKTDVKASKNFVLVQMKALLAKYAFQDNTDKKGLENELHKIQLSNDLMVKEAMGQFDKAKALLK